MPTAYGKSKVLAEKAVWNFVDERKKANQLTFEVAVVHPVLSIQKKRKILFCLSKF